MSADVIEQMLETTRRTTNIASRLVQSLEFRHAARPSAELNARIELAKILRDSMLRKVGELEQLVKDYRTAEKRIGGEAVRADRWIGRVCPKCRTEWEMGERRLVKPICPNCGVELLP